MHYIKPIIYTALYIVFIELIGAWLFIAHSFEVDFLINYYILINGLITASSLIVFTYFTNNRKLNLPQSSSVKWYLFAIVLGILFVFIQTPLNWIYNFISKENYYIIYDFDGFENFTDINTLSLIIFLPISEELFFREFLQKNLQKHANAFVSIGLSSVLFASIHLPYLNLIFGYTSFSTHHAFITLFGGLILGFIYYRSKSIGPAIVLHLVWNLVVLIT